MPQAEQTLSDRYRLQQKLGQDASRQTWLAADSCESSRQVVVKLLAFNPQMQWDESKLFEREAQALQSLNHPRIPQYLDYFTIDSLPDSRFPWFALVQTYIPGESLQERLDRGDRFHTDDIEKIARELLRILVYLHDRSTPMLHRDIKPSNVIWGEDNHLYLVDFGAVQDQAAQEGATFTVVGTYGYVPIEQFGGRAVPASDLYALGMTLIHLLTGTAPADLPQQNGRVQFADWLSLDPGWVNWLSKLTAPSLSDRFVSAQQALAALVDRHALSTTQTPQPVGSKIQVRRSDSQLEILTPPRGRAAYNFVYLISTGATAAALLVVLLLQFSAIGGIPIWLLLMFGLSYSGRELASRMRKRLRLDREWLTLRHELFGFCYYQQRIRLSAITQILAGDDFDRLHKVILNASGCSTNAQYRTVLAKLSDRLVIQANGKLYCTNSLSIADRLWLRDEVQDWIRRSQE